MAQIVKEGSLLWEPAEEFKQQSNLFRYVKWLEKKHNLFFQNYEDLWKWSVTEIELFWETIWDYFQIQASTPYLKVLSERKMPGSRWFEGAKLNYAEHIFRNGRENRAAILAKSEIRSTETITWQQLERHVSSFAFSLRQAGVHAGDRVVAYIPNIPEAVIAFLACASIGAVWSSCSPDFGSPTVIDRFKQIEPKILVAVDGYRYGGKDFNRLPALKDIQNALSTLEKTVLLPYLSNSPNVQDLKDTVLWNDFMKQRDGSNLVFEQVSFDHPLWILYSSGTTGIPKAIVQGHGGILLEHLKQVCLHMNLKPEDRFFWFTTTGWMMWNIVISGLLSGSTILLYDGNPGYPDLRTLWQFAEESEMSVFGTSASYLLSCMNAELCPKEHFDLSKLRTIGSTGSPLPFEGFAWVYKHVKDDIWLTSVSGGTDLCSAFVGGSPLLPVHAGEIQCRELGAKVEAFDDVGNSLIGQVGELVVTEPMPSMPVYFWNDPKGEKLRRSYFDMYPGIWRHGDWIEITSKGSCKIYGRSDSTINRGGIRMGTSEIYSAVESISEVQDSLDVDVINDKGKGYMPLFAVLKEGVKLNESIEKVIKQRIRENCSPRHVPDKIFQIHEVPRTLNGKKLEVPIKKILMGVPLEKAVNKGSLSNPDSLEYFVKLREESPFV